MELNGGPTSPVTSCYHRTDHLPPVAGAGPGTEPSRPGRHGFELVVVATASGIGSIVAAVGQGGRLDHSRHYGTWIGTEAESDPTFDQAVCYDPAEGPGFYQRLDPSLAVLPLLVVAAVVAGIALRVAWGRWPAPDPTAAKPQPLPRSVGIGGAAVVSLAVGFGAQWTLFGLAVRHWLHPACVSGWTPTLPIGVALLASMTVAAGATGAWLEGGRRQRRAAREEGRARAPELSGPERRSAQSMRDQSIRR